MSARVGIADSRKASFVDPQRSGASLKTAPLKHDSSWLARFAALAEVSLALLAGNLLAALLLGAAMPQEVRQLADDFEAPSFYLGAAASALTLTTRFGLMIAIGAALLWWRRRETLRDHGLTRAGRSLSSLLVSGVVLYAVASLPLHLVFAVNARIPLGEGLPLWDSLSGRLHRPDFWLLMLSGSVVLPPLYEETFMRGYMRGRLQENFDAMGAVVVSSFLFMLAHGHFYAADGLLILSLLVGIFAAFCWGYSVVRTGSLIPAMIAHGLGNLPIPGTLRDEGLLVLFSLVVIVAARKPLLAQIRACRTDWRASDPAGTAFGVGVAVVFLVPLLTLNAMGQGRLVVTLGIGWILLFLAGLAAQARQIPRTGPPSRAA